ncbi:DgyrCDS3648 [Dimorphilus gyrociliatus]|nr:DgyrCDS3648 [Dimorphilus gyrociliatus]
MKFRNKTMKKVKQGETETGMGMKWTPTGNEKVSTSSSINGNTASKQADPSEVTDEVSAKSEMVSNGGQNDLQEGIGQLACDCEISSEDETVPSEEIIVTESIDPVCPLNPNRVEDDSCDETFRPCSEEFSTGETIGPIDINDLVQCSAIDEPNKIVGLRSSRLMKLKKQFKGTFARSVAKIHRMYLKIDNANREELAEYRAEIRNDEDSTTPASGTFTSLSAQNSPLKFITPVSTPSELKNLEFCKDSDENADCLCEEKNIEPNDKLLNKDTIRQLTPMEKFTHDSKSKGKDIFVQNICFGEEEKSFFCDLKELENLTGEKIVFDEVDDEEDDEDDDESDIEDDTIDNSDSGEDKIEELRKIANEYIKDQSENLSAKEIWCGKVDDSTDVKISYDNDLWETHIVEKDCQISS